MIFLKYLKFDILGAILNQTRPITSTYSFDNGKFGDILRTGMPLLSDYQPAPSNNDVAIVQYPASRLYVT